MEYLGYPVTNLLPEKKIIPGFTGYAVDKAGDIWSRIYKKKQFDNFGHIIWKKRKSWKKKDGYLILRLQRDDDKKMIKKYTHRLTLETFTSNIENKPCVLHGNGIRDDNRLDNLYWGTYLDNLKDAHRHGTTNLGRPGHGKLNEIQVLVIKKALTLGVSSYNLLKFLE